MSVGLKTIIVMRDKFFSLLIASNHTDKTHVSDDSVPLAFHDTPQHS